jgi:hypothetical protein
LSASFASQTSFSSGAKALNYPRACQGRWEAQKQFLLRSLAVPRQRPGWNFIVEFGQFAFVVDGAL